MSTTKNFCNECKSELFGRVDKKFCSDACRNTYNNRQNSDSNNYMRKVNGILRKNRRILMEFNPEGDKKKTNKERLLKAGYNFEFHTNILKTKAGKTYRFCYEQGYLELDNDWYMLVVRND